jgi:hypothetical protein
LRLPQQHQVVTDKWLFLTPIWGQADLRYIDPTSRSTSPGLMIDSLPGVPQATNKICNSTNTMEIDIILIHWFFMENDSFIPRYSFYKCNSIF